MKAIFSLILLAITFSFCQASQHVFSIQGTDLYLNNQEFKILGMRCSNALVSEKTTQDLIEHLPGRGRSGPLDPGRVQPCGGQHIEMAV